MPKLSLRQLKHAAMQASLKAIATKYEIRKNLIETLPPINITK